MLVILILWQIIITFARSINTDLEYNKQVLQKRKENGYKMPQGKIDGPAKDKPITQILVGCSGMLYLLIALPYFLDKLFRYADVYSGATIICLLLSMVLRRKGMKWAAIIVEILCIISMVAFGFTFYS